MVLFLCLEILKVGFGESDEYFKGLNFQEGAGIQNIMQTKFGLPMPFSGD